MMGKLQHVVIATPGVSHLNVTRRKVSFPIEEWCEMAKTNLFKVI